MTNYFLKVNPSENPLCRAKRLFRPQLSCKSLYLSASFQLFAHQRDLGLVKAVAPAREYGVRFPYRSRSSNAHNAMGVREHSSSKRKDKQSFDLPIAGFEAEKLAGTWTHHQP
jgi:hypothetical protein